MCPYVVKKSLFNMKVGAKHAKKKQQTLMFSYVPSCGKKSSNPKAYSTKKPEITFLRLLLY